MSITWGMVRPGSLPNAGDIFIRRSDGAQSRWTGAAWEVITPAVETRGDSMPSGGLQDQILVRGLGTNPFAVGWADPGPGLIWENDFTNLDEWTCDHGLRNRYVAVLVIKTDGTLMVPEIDYANATDNLIVLKFVEPVSGTAIIRR